MLIFGLLLLRSSNDNPAWSRKQKQKKGRLCGQLFPNEHKNSIYKDKTIAIKLMYILFPNDDIQNFPFCRFKLVVETFEH